ncbi:hypothetical protein AWENTII_003461 [Aspergillus wentii]
MKLPDSEASCRGESIVADVRGSQPLAQPVWSAEITSRRLAASSLVENFAAAASMHRSAVASAKSDLRIIKTSISPTPPTTTSSYLAYALLWL